ncbi:MAG: tetratricopeptide repeat protein [Caldilineaceae bacterium]|nr:tetratricopeptide repeat protein [Caldilineaceae bacterium]
MKENPTITDYTTVRLLGQGGMAEVYEGLDPDLNRPVAIKLIHPRLGVDAQFEARFRLEARLVASLRHPHIVQVYDYQVTDDGPVMVMEYLPGGSLKDRLDDLRSRGQRLPLAETAAITDALASALDYAHRQGAIHRDVKPANILFDKEGAPVLADFGIARILDDQSGLTQPGTILGTPAYLSPEQAAGEVAGPSSDLYSLGVVLYEMVTGAPPFQGTTTAILTGHAASPPPPARSRVADLPEAVEHALQRALAKQPAQRYPSGAALAQAFRAAIGEVGAAAPLTEQPTLIEGKQATSAKAKIQADAPPAPPAISASANDDRMAQLADKLDVLSPLIGHSIPDAYRDGRSRLATTLGLIGLLFALLKFLTDFLDLAQKAWRPVGLALQSLPLLVGLLLLAGAGAALVALRRPNRMLNRQRALGLFVGLALAGLLWSGWTVAQWLRPPDKLIVAIGEFERFSSRVGNPAGDLFVAMERAFAPLQERVSVQRTFRTYTSAAEASADGIARGAVALLWGSYSDDGVTVYLEAMDLPAQAEIGGVALSLQKFSGLAERIGIGRAAPAGQMGRFQRQPLYIPDRVSFTAAETEQMTAAAAFVLGVSFQLAGERESASALLDQAVAGLGQGTSRLVGGEMLYFQRGVLRWEEGRQDEAIADMEQAVALAPDYYPARYNLAIFYASDCPTPARIEQAIAQAEDAAQLRPNDDSHRSLLASLYLQAGRRGDALALLDQSGTAAPTTAEEYLFLAQLYTGLGEAAKAAEAVEQVLALLADQPSDGIQEQLMLGTAYLLGERYGEALAAFRAVTEADPENPDGWQGVGDAHFWQEEWDAAQSAYTKVVALTPESGDGYLLLGLTASAAGDRFAAAAALAQAAERTACDPTPALLLGGEYVLQDEYTLAIAAFQKVLALDPENENALYLLGSVYVLQEDWEQAEDAYARAAAIQPDDPSILHGLARSLSAQGKAVESEGPWRRYTELLPDDSEAWQFLALALLFQGRNDEAAAVARQGLAVAEGAELYVSLGMALDGLGEDEDALAAFREALALDPKNAGAYRGIGEISRRAGALDEAIAAYAEAARLSSVALDFVALAALYQQVGQIDAGLAAIGAALALEPDNSDALLRAGLLERDAGNLAAAEGYFQRSTRLRPDDPLPLLGLVQVAYQQCRLSSAAQAAKQMAEVGTAPFFRMLLASIYLAQNRQAEAQTILDELRASPVNDSDAHGAAARLLLRQDRLDEALAEFQLALEAAPPGTLGAALLPYELGVLYLLLDQPLPGASEFSRALALRPAMIPAQVSLGDVALWQGEWETALGHYATAWEALPVYRPLTDQENYDILAAQIQAKEALVMGKLGQVDAADEMMTAALTLGRQLVEANPQNPTAQFALGGLHLLAGAREEADVAFAQAIQCDASLAVAREQTEKVVQQFQE